MVMNHQTIQLLRKIGPVRVVSHDWWVYMIVSGVNGFIAYDTQPSIYYRQHEKNKVGANNTSIKAHLIRIKMLYSGIFRRWNSVNKQALVVARQYLHHEHQQTLDEFVELRKASFLKRILIAKKLKLFRQTFAGNLALIYATLFKKL
jgi:hypothetical protein